MILNGEIPIIKFSKLVVRKVPETAYLSFWTRPAGSWTAGPM